MSKRTMQIVELMDHINSNHTMDCYICNKTDSVNDVDEFDALDYFYDKGWRVVKSTTLKDNIPVCKKCKPKVI